MKIITQNSDCCKKHLQRLDKGWLLKEGELGICFMRMRPGASLTSNFSAGQLIAIENALEATHKSNTTNREDAIC